MEWDCFAPCSLLFLFYGLARWPFREESAPPATSFISLENRQAYPIAAYWIRSGEGISLSSSARELCEGRFFVKEITRDADDT